MLSANLVLFSKFILHHELYKDLKAAFVSVYYMYLWPVHKTMHFNSIYTKSTCSYQNLTFFQLMITDHILWLKYLAVQTT